MEKVELKMTFERTFPDSIFTSNKLRSATITIVKAATLLQRFANPANGAVVLSCPHYHHVACDQSHRTI
jgi:hypothetical protein